MRLLLVFTLQLLLQLSGTVADECNCPRKFHPVCGSDANTYNNLCVLQCQISNNKDLQLAHNGSCCPEIRCPTERIPICDNFGRTHHNVCFMNRARCLARKTTNNLISKAYDGACFEIKQEDCSTFCDFPGSPVCDHLGNTYETQCTLERVNCERRNQGEKEFLLVSYKQCNNTSILPESEITEELFVSPEEFARLSFSNVSSSEDSIRDAKIVPAKPLSNVQVYDITQPCSAANCDKSWNPVCDANNKTHRNLCLFKFHTCKLNRFDGSVLDLLHEGECSDRLELGICRICTKQEEKFPVCDNLNLTHASLCEISRFNCFQRLNHKPERVLVHFSACTAKSPIFTLENEKCPVKCAEVRKPVCDEAGVTHSNLCFFQRSHCAARQEGRQAPMLKHGHECSKEDKLVELGTEATVGVDADMESNETVTDRYNKEDSTTISSESSLFECPLPTCEEDNSTPLCDSQGKIHENVCMFTYARCTAAQKGEFLTIDQDEKCFSAKCKETCDNRTKLLCGSDLNTYNNECFFYKEKCNDATLDILFYGACSECLPSPCPVLSSDAPDSAFVCDAEDTTRSLCEYQMLSCIADKHPALNFSIIHLGKCCGNSETCRSRPENMICGKDGRTYRNQCELGLENCRNEKLLVSTVEYDYKGECKSNANVAEKGETVADERFPFEDIDSNETEMCNSTCGNTYAPVCGVDEITYTNLCALQASNCKNRKTVEVAYDGECCELKCPSNFDPVCDAEGATHQNLCYFGQQRCIAEKTSNKKLTIAKFDVCTNDCTMVCTKEYSPICGTNGNTYVNMCEMEKQNCFIEKNITIGSLIVQDYQGECCPDLNCDFGFAPVCDSEGTTHTNDCVFKQSQCVQSRRGYVNLTVQYKGACCNQGCENDYVPVCDGNTTHENVCRFRVAQCEAERKGSTLNLAYIGECCVSPQGECKNSDTVCDSYGQTHLNTCQFEHKKCLLERTTKKNLSVVHKGECCAIEPCHKVDEPICDTHGGTHASLCHFQNTQCIHNKKHPHSLIRFAYKGKCCPSDCGEEWAPVCDQHGAIYKNNCWFQRKACEYTRRSLGLLLQTPCTDRRIRSLAPRLRSN